MKKKILATVLGLACLVSAQSWTQNGSTGNYFWSNLSSNLGIGVNDPAYKLDIQSPSSYNLLRLRHTGSSGTPLLKLSGGYNSGNGAELWQDVPGNLRLNVHSSLTGLLIAPSGDITLGNSQPAVYHPLASHLVLERLNSHAGMTIASGPSNFGTIHFANGKVGDAAYRGFIQYRHSSDPNQEYLEFGTKAATRMIIESNGRAVFMNRATVEGRANGEVAFVVDQRMPGVIAQFKRDGQVKVNIAEDGNISSSGSLTVGSVVTNNWTVSPPDYVFEKDYKLRSLDEVDSFVKKNKHLPEVPSAKDFKEKGMDLAEMNFVLLKKVEELTLHAIRQEKRSRAQEARINELESRLAKGKDR